MQYCVSITDYSPNRVQRKFNKTVARERKPQHPNKTHFTLRFISFNVAGRASERDLYLIRLPFRLQNFAVSAKNLNYKHDAWTNERQHQEAANFVGNLFHYGSHKARKLINFIIEFRLECAMLESRKTTLTKKPQSRYFIDNNHRVGCLTFMLSVNKNLNRILRLYC